MTRTEALLAEIARKGSTRDSIAVLYREGIRACLGPAGITGLDWPAVNSAILSRYRVSGLNYIKAKAWKK
jgi:hypothetical protein